MEIYSFKYISVVSGGQSGGTPEQAANAYFNIFLIMALIFALLIAMDMYNKHKKRNKQEMDEGEEMSKNTEINNDLTDRLKWSMIEYYKGDPDRINHFLKVYEYSKIIGKSENISDGEMFILEAAALVHDIGIKLSEQKYQSADGKYQELEGPPEAEKMLTGLGFPAHVTERVCWLTAHHHTYSGISGNDYQILVEADFIVNIHEGKMSADSIKNVKENIFRTETGKKLLELIYI